MKQLTIKDVADGYGCIEFYEHMVIFYFPNEQSKKLDYDELWMYIRENDEI